MEVIWKVKIQSQENICICKHFIFGFTCSTFATHLYLLFNIVTMDCNALSEPGNEFFLFQHRRNLSPALLAMSSPRLEPHHRPKKSFLRFRKQVIVTWCKVWAVWWMGQYFPLEGLQQLLHGASSVRTGVIVQ
jgi:hypothetical protein